MHLFQKTVVSVFLLASLCVAPVSLARAATGAGETQQAFYEKAKRALAEERYEDTIELLDRVDPTTTPDPIQPVFMRGMALLNLNRGSEAVGLFQSILETNPDFLRVRLELARAFFSYGDASRAQHHFNIVLASGVPLVVESNIRRFLTSIEERRLWFFNLNMSVAQDSNISRRKEVDLNVFGQRLPFLFNDDSRDSGRGVSTYMSATRLMPLDLAHAFHLQASANLTDYAGEEFDDLGLSFTPSLQYVSEKGGLVRGGPFIRRRWLGQDYYATTLGLRLTTTDVLAPRLSLATTFEIQEINYETSLAGNDGFSIYGRTGLTRQLASGSSIGISIDGRRHKNNKQERTARNHKRSRDDLSYHHGSVGVSYGRKLPWKFNAFLETRVGRRVYEGPRAFSVDGKRHDTVYTTRLVLSNDNITLGKLLPSLTVEYTTQNSSYNDSDFSRTVYSLSMRRQF